MEEQLKPAAPVIDPEKILRELRELWAQLAKEQGSAGGVLRACSMTLIAVAEHDDEADAELARKTIGVLMHGHPSRAIVLTPREGGEFSGRVFAECWMPFGGQSPPSSTTMALRHRAGPHWMSSMTRKAPSACCG